MPLEKTIQADIVKYLNKMEGCHVWKNHGGAYTNAGVPDVIGVYKGKFLGIEVKQPKKKGNVTRLQGEFINKLNDCGGISFVATCIGDVEEKLELNNDINEVPWAFRVIG